MKLSHGVPFAEGDQVIIIGDKMNGQIGQVNKVNYEPGSLPVIWVQIEGENSDQLICKEEDLRKIKKAKT